MSVLGLFIAYILVSVFMFIVCSVGEYKKRKAMKAEENVG